MKFIEYPDEGARRNKRDGVLRKGQEISAAGPSGHWVFTPEDKTFHRVYGLASHGGGTDLKSSIATESHSPGRVVEQLQELDATRKGIQ